MPGLRPKPRPELYRPQLLRVLLAALERSRPAAARRLAEHPRSFVVAAWSHLFYGMDRDIALDLPGIERLLAHVPPTELDRRAVASWRTRVKRFAHMIGDALPVLGKWLARPATRLQMHEATRYLRNRDGIGDAVRAVVRAELTAAWSARERVLLIGHSLGTVIAYDTLFELSREGHADRVDVFVTMGSPLATRFIRRRLSGHGLEGPAAYPHNIRRWVNFSARGDTTALRPRLKPFFQEMIDLGLTETIEDHVDLENYFRGSLGLNAHESYGYLAQPALAEVVGDWLERC